MLEMWGSTLFYYTEDSKLWRLDVHDEIPIEITFEDEDFSWAGLQSISVGTEHLAIVNSNFTVSTMGKNKYG